LTINKISYKSYEGQEYSFFIDNVSNSSIEHVRYLISGHHRIPVSRLTMIFIKVSEIGNDVLSESELLAVADIVNHHQTLVELAQRHPEFGGFRDDDSPEVWRDKHGSERRLKDLLD